MEKVNLAEKLEAFDEVFSPRIVGYYNDDKIQVGKAHGDFVWHTHPTRTTSSSCSRDA